VPPNPLAAARAEDAAAFRFALSFPMFRDSRLCAALMARARLPDRRDEAAVKFTAAGGKATTTADQADVLRLQTAKPHTRGKCHPTLEERSRATLDGHVTHASWRPCDTVSHALNASRKRQPPRPHFIRRAE
jgi:hypothetical protein